jgi:hypothetical protein
MQYFPAFRLILGKTNIKEVFFLTLIIITYLIKGVITPNVIEFNNKT